jgi:hypothetical protein
LQSAQEKHHDQWSQNDYEFIQSSISQINHQIAEFANQLVTVEDNFKSQQKNVEKIS